MIQPPAWWGPIDTAICEAWHDWRRGTGTLAFASHCTCRTCHYWASDNGSVGDCTMPATPATVNCGTTHARSGCEQWEPRLEDER